MHTDNRIDLLNAVFSNNCDCIEKTVERMTDKNLKKRFDTGTFVKKTIVAIACLKTSVLPNTLDTLLNCINKKCGKIDFIDDSWYGWEPIHYAAQSGDVEKLKTVEKFLDVNVLTYHSENALHILIESRRNEVYGILYDNCTPYYCTLIEDVKNNIFECAEYLIKRGINANQRNLWGKSFLHLATEYRFENFVKLIKERFPQETLMDEYYSNADLFIDPVCTIYNRMKSNKDDFLHMLNGNIREHVVVVDGQNEFCSSGSMLQMCLRKFFLEYLQCDSYNIELDSKECNILNTPLLKVYCASQIKR